MNEELQRVIEKNFMLQRKAKKLNIRAGQEIFPIMDQVQWEEWLAERLAGVGRVRDIVNLESLQLPELDQKKIDQVLAENPDSIDIAGQTFLVDYRENLAPQIVLNPEQIEQKIWVNLPEEGVKLPSEQSVEVKAVVIPGEYGLSFTSLNIPELKEKLKNHLNTSVWIAWEKPVGVLPDSAIATAVIPEITVQEYGKCVVTGDILWGYGAIAARLIGARDHISWDFRWFREKEEAERTWERSKAVLAQLQLDARKTDALARINIPDPAQENSRVPDVVEIEGGFGTVCVNHNRRFGSDQHFQTIWLRSREDANWQHEMAVKRLNEVRESEIEKRKLHEVRNEAGVVKAKVRRLYNQTSRHLLEKPLQEKLYKLYLSDIPFEYVDICVWKSETIEICTEIGKAYAELEKQQAEIEKAFSDSRSLISREYATCPICDRQTQEIDFTSAETSVHEDESGDEICDCFYNVSQKAEVITGIIKEGYYGELAACSGSERAVVATRTTRNGKTLAELLVFYKWGQWSCHLQAYPENYREVGEVKTFKVFSPPSEYDFRLRKLEMEKEAYWEEITQANEAVKNGSAHRLRFRQEPNPQTGGMQWVSGNKQVKYVVDGSHRIQIDDRHEYYCQENFRRIASRGFQLIPVRPYLMKGRDFEAEIAALKIEYGIEEAPVQAKMETECKQDGSKCSVLDFSVLLAQKASKQAKEVKGKKVKKPAFVYQVGDWK